MRDDYDDEYENGGSRRGCLWLMFCGPGALSFWFTRMYPQNEADAISAHHRKDNVAAQFISTMAIYAAIAVMAVFWNMAFDSDGTAN